MKTIRICAGCGKPVDADAPAGLCPECLLKSGVSRGGDDAPGSVPTPIPGETFGEYRIERLLGHGGMGRVYEAEQAQTGRRVALKVIGAALASDADRKRFLREGRLAAAVNHPNVVYVHGSEEIDGVPAIAMELVHGGTLKDRLKREGTLPVSEAVEAVLQVIDGLEAAHAAGVLHRDIKPANCFVAADGTVKVGDFGLSVSTLARGESLLTATGAVLGTPAYASPEQLRGEELDVRSDIYSVGAMFYHLVTGRTPFTSTDFVKLITEVLDKQAPPPGTLRSEVPPELSRVIMRCLAKDRRSRFASYAALRDALLPFRKAEVVPANPGVRLVAYLLDDLIAYLPSMFFMAYWSLDPLDLLVRDRTLHALLTWGLFYLWFAAYFAVTEGLWGGGLGKILCGLRVVNLAGQVPGIPRALLRTGLFMLPGTLPSFVMMVLVSRQTLLAQLARGESWVTDWIWLPLTLALAVTMRRRNGFAAVHDLFSKTRVIVRAKTQPRPSVTSRPLPPATVPTGHPAPEFRPFETRALLWRQNGEELWLAHDAMLRRDIWVHAHANGAGNTAHERHDLSRPARLRWLSTGVSATHSWDAYEALPGEALTTITRQPQPWSAARFWIADLAEEMVAAELHPATAPQLALDRVWITNSGRAVLLDFPAPGAVPAAQPAPVAMNPQAFLSEAAKLSLGHESNLVPLHARQFLASLQRQAFDSVEFVVGNIHSLLAKPAEVTTPRRIASLTLVPTVCAVLSLVFAAMVTFQQMRTERVWRALYPHEASFEAADRVYGDTGDDESAESQRKHLLAAIYLGKHFGSALTNETLWSNPNFVESQHYRDRLTNAFRVADRANAKETQQAEEIIPPLIEAKAREARLAGMQVAFGTGAVLTIFSAFVGLILSLAFGVSPILHLFGLVLVDRQGERAGRGRLSWRWLLTWLPVGFISGVALIIGTLIQGDAAFSSEAAGLRTLALCVAPALFAVLAGSALYAAVRPSRGLVDQLAGTRLVPR